MENNPFKKGGIRITHRAGEIVGDEKVAGSFCPSTGLAVAVFTPHIITIFVLRGAKQTTARPWTACVEPRQMLADDFAQL
eukprot:3625275-Rhodomonas_salina.1